MEEVEGGERREEVEGSDRANKSNIRSRDLIQMSRARSGNRKR